MTGFRRALTMDRGEKRPGRIPGRRLYTTGSTMLGRMEAADGAAFKKFPREEERGFPHFHAKRLRGNDVPFGSSPQCNVGAAGSGAAAAVTAAGNGTRFSLDCTRSKSWRRGSSAARQRRSKKRRNRAAVRAHEPE